MKNIDKDLVPVSVLLIFFSPIVLFLSDAPIDVRIGGSVFTAGSGLIGIYKAFSISRFIKKHLIMRRRNLSKPII